jgi:hypothetical protein
VVVVVVVAVKDAFTTRQGSEAGTSPTCAHRRFKEPREGCARNGGLVKQLTGHAKDVALEVKHLNISESNAQACTRLGLVHLDTRVEHKQTNPST